MVHWSICRRLLICWVCTQACCMLHLWLLYASWLLYSCPYLLLYSLMKSASTVSEDACYHQKPSCNGLRAGTTYLQLCFCHDNHSCRCIKLKWNKYQYKPKQIPAFWVLFFITEILKHWEMNCMWREKWVHSKSERLWCYEMFSQNLKLMWRT